MNDVEIHDFEDWNAKAVYFYDEDKNIVELISRNNLEITSSNRFDQSQFLNISEIGIPTTSIEILYKKFNSLMGLEVFDGGVERFCAIGDEYGLFICINKEIRKWYPNDDQAFASPFEARVQVEDNVYSVNYTNELLTISDKTK